MAHINWVEKGFKGRALTYLAADSGFLNPFPHRALFDCATTFKLIESRLEELLNKSRQKEYLISAIGAPFESKDKLKQRNYHWDVKQRVWKKRVLDSEIFKERLFLEEEVYKGISSHREEAL